MVEIDDEDTLTILDPELLRKVLKQYPTNDPVRQKHWNRTISKVDKFIEEVENVFNSIIPDSHANIGQYYRRYRNDVRRIMEKIEIGPTWTWTLYRQFESDLLSSTVDEWKIPYILKAFKQVLPKYL